MLVGFLCLFGKQTTYLSFLVCNDIIDGVGLELKAINRCLCEHGNKMLDDHQIALS